LRTVPRRRHYLSHRGLVFLAPLFRYCPLRDAYILRLVGRWTGPVLRVDRRTMRRRRRPSGHKAKVA